MILINGPLIKIIFGGLELGEVFEEAVHVGH